MKQILGSLPPQQRELLMYAFEHGLSQYVEYKPGLFIGVNISMIKHLVISESNGIWSIGEIK